MPFKRALLLTGLFAIATCAQQTKPPQPHSEPVLPYTPSLDPAAMNPAADACVDFYEYSCGGWRKLNPIPSDQTSWSVYAKLYEDNLNYLRGILEEASTAANRDAVAQKIGDYYASCMDEAEVEKLRAKPLQSDLLAIQSLKSAKELAGLIANLHIEGNSALFSSAPGQDPDNSDDVIMGVSQGGLGLPDRDYYVKDDAKSKETRERYLQHVQKMFELLGDSPDTAKNNAAVVMRMETGLAKASLTRVERRDPYKQKHKMSVPDLYKIAPDFDWNSYFAASGAPKFPILNVGWPDFFKEVDAQLKSNSLQDWKSYLRWHIANARAPYLSSAFVNENFEFYRKYLRGAKELQPRWKRCVRRVDDDLGEALGQAYVQKTFPPELKSATVEMTRRIEDAMALRIQQLDWMSPQTKQQAQTKLRAIRNKVGYPDNWRDYSSVKIVRGDFYGNDLRATAFEIHRQLNKVGKPVDRGEWDMTAATVNADYSPTMNDINFPAGILQPPFYGKLMDDAVNYGGIGVVIGHELTHGFDDQGRKFDAEGNFKDWWTPEDGKEFEERVSCTANEYSNFVTVKDDKGEVKLNGRLTLGENTADNGGLKLAYMALTKIIGNTPIKEIDGYTPQQRFFLSYGQIWCQNVTDQEARKRALTDPHSPGRWRVNGAVQNSAAFQEAFSCHAGQPMVSENACRVW